MFVGFHLHAAMGLTIRESFDFGSQVAIPRDCVGTKWLVQGIDADVIQRVELAILADDFATILASGAEIQSGVTE